MLHISNLEKTFILQDGGRVNAIRAVSFHIPKGKFFTLLGPSGCGKTTTLRAIAGLEQPDRGSIVIGPNTVFDGAQQIFVPPNKRQIGMVFQSYAIWPHMNVFENVAFPLRVSTKLNRQEIARRVERVLETVHLGGYGDRPATRLSGGQQQRLALARALVVEPDLLLLDEPLSNLDAKLRESMRFELRRLQKEVGVTTVFVTHDQTEALSLSDEIAVMNEGEIAQLGDPQTIYNQPSSRFVATFIGSTNLVSAKVAARPAGTGEGVVDTPHGRLQGRFSASARVSSEVVVCIRPENIALAPAGTVTQEPGLNVLKGRIRERLFVGEMIDYVVVVDGSEFRARGSQMQSRPIDEQVALCIRPEHCFILPTQ
jgi:iron(III) transport system ATP-binding protein